MRPRRTLARRRLILGVIACLLLSAGALRLPGPVAAAATCGGSELQQVSAGSHDYPSVARTVPVVFVHGIVSSSGIWDPQSPASLAGQAARLPGTTAWTFDYHKEDLDWVTKRAIGPTLAEDIGCLAQMSGHSVVIVAHSMGGLAAQYALGESRSPAAGHVAELITIGTPFTGSQILSVAETLANGGLGALDSPTVAFVEALLSACAGIATHTDSNPCWFASVIRAPVGTDLESNSQAIAELPAWPASLPVLDTAGDMTIKVGAGDLAFDVHPGDGAVGLQSATAHDTVGSPDIVTCHATIVSFFSASCFHLSLPGNRGVIAAILAAIRGLTAPTRIVDLAPVEANGLPEPGDAITDRGAAQCEAGSDSAGQAYRCFAGNGIYDPCWLDNGDPAQSTVLCQEEPWSTQTIRLTVPAGGLPSFLGPAQRIDLGFPWGVQLSDGERCIAEQGSHGTFEGKVVDYACGTSYDHVLLRPLTRAAPQWTYQSAFCGASGSCAPGPLEHVAIAWYANPDDSAALDAKANDCTATALADAAQAYEAAHSNPDGPLPDINAQACDGGYAEIVFTQTARSPGYTATIAFKATASGWQEIGSADFIIPGQFGMPLNVGKAINKSLSAAPQTEEVAF
jgi:pimeloyl-ACP methyl ester carboxylesterase